MQITKFEPALSLRKFVKCYYYIENPSDDVFDDVYFADGCIEAVFSLGWSFYKDEDREDWAKIIGQIIKPRKLRIQGKGQSFGIWFYPHTFSYFADVQMCEMNDDVLSWDLLFPNSVGDFVGNAMSDMRIDSLVACVDKFLMQRLSARQRKSVDVMMDAAIQYLYRHKGGSDLGELASLLQVSQRYLQKLFLSKVGVSQKHFVRILRFQQALQTLGQRDMANLTGLAYESGYYDQSHFIREFKNFTGLTPSTFEATKLPINQHFILTE